MSARAPASSRVRRCDVGWARVVVAVDPRRRHARRRQTPRPTMTSVAVRRATACRPSRKNCHVSLAVMFFSDRRRAVEMRQVIRPGGRVAGDHHMGIRRGIAGLCGDGRAVGGMVLDRRCATVAVLPWHARGRWRRDAPVVRRRAVVRRDGQARFTSLNDWLYTEIRRRRTHTMRTSTRGCGALRRRGLRALSTATGW